MTEPCWHLALDHCRSLDDIRRQWDALLERDGSLPGQDRERYQDALLSFIGRSALSPHLRLAALLACVDSGDFDLRLALGALDDQVRASRAPWPGSVAGAVAANGPAMQVASQQDWLGAFVVGRLAGLRDGLVQDGAGVEAWRAAFWDHFLAAAARRGWPDAGRLALERGADPHRVGAPRYSVAQISRLIFTNSGHGSRSARCAT